MTPAVGVGRRGVGRRRRRRRRGVGRRRRGVGRRWAIPAPGLLSLTQGLCRKVGPLSLFKGQLENITP